MSSSEDNLSDVSLDEEDEELIWRVFYGDYEKKVKSNSNSGYPTDDEEGSTSDNVEEGTPGSGGDSSADGILGKRKRDDTDEEVSGLSDIDDAELVARYEDLKGLLKKKNGKNISEIMSPPVLNEEEKKRLIIGSFTEEQMDRFESYRRMTVNKPGVKKVCNAVVGHSIAQNIAVVLAGLSKLFLGEIITRAMEIQERDYKARLVADIETKKRQKQDILKSLEQGKEVEVDDKKLSYFGDRQIPLQPEHIREAWRLYKLENGGTISSSWRQQGDGDGKLFR